MIIHMARYKENGNIHLCKAAHSAKAILEKRGYVQIEESEWERLHQEWRKEKLGEK